ncbi:MAG TPA: hypothetical protein VFQ70_01965 [Candidatus Saccharimonadaceae bacterium]|nr:hypothetical protein [Candidatus Saccharimonadaceae bacterium]
MKDQLASLLGKEMDRKEFLRVIGVGAMLLVGGSAILSALSHLTGTKPGVQSNGGYGASAYGGQRDGR